MKVNKKLEDFDGQEPSYAVDLDYYDKEENRNKFWRVRVFGRFVVRQWGRHGTKGQQMCEDHHYDFAAKAVARNLEMEKRNKGYRPEASVLDRFAREV